MSTPRWLRELLRNWPAAVMILGTVGGTLYAVGHKLANLPTELQAETLHRLAGDSLLGRRADSLALRTTALEQHGLTLTVMTTIQFKDWCRHTPLSRQQDVSAVQYCKAALNGTPFPDPRP